jgi:hypothetical protein
MIVRSNLQVSGFASTLRPAWVLTREVLRTRTTIAVLVAALALDLFARWSLRWTLADGGDSEARLTPELRWLLASVLALMLLLRSERWRPLLRGLSSTSVYVVVFLSCVYLQCFCLLVLSIPTLARGAGYELLARGAVGELCFLGSLTGLLALTRLDSRALAVVFALLAWCVPLLGYPEQSGSISGTIPMTRSPWTADGILPMLVPQLLALGFVCLERWRR